MKVSRLRRVLASAALALFTACALTACAPDAPQAARQAPAWAPKLAPLETPVTVKVGMKQVVSDVGILVGMARGYYRDLGIVIEPTQFSSGQEMINQLAAGQLDVGATVSSSGLFNAMSRDIPVKIVADKGINVPGRGYYRLVVRHGLEDVIKDYGDLRGRKIAVVGTASLDELALDRVLHKGAMTLADVDMQVIRSFPDMLVSLGNGSIDAAMVIEPFVTQGMKKGLLSPWKDPVEYDPLAQTAILVYGAGFMKNTEAAERFMTAYVQSVRDYNDAFFKNKNKPEMIDLLSKYSVVKDPALYENMYPVGLNPDGYLKTKGIELDLDWYRAHKLLKSDIRLDDAVDHRFVDFALSVLGAYEPLP